MIKYKNQKKVIKSKSVIICDKCKKEFDLDTEEGILELQEFHQIDFVGGYGSVFGDMQHITVDICQNCLLEIIKDFMVVQSKDYRDHANFIDDDYGINLAIEVMKKQ